MQYRAKEGEMLDALCHRYYGPRAGAVEAVLGANLGLAKKGPFLPVGELIELPVLPEIEKPARIVLWE